METRRMESFLSGFVLVFAHAFFAYPLTAADETHMFDVPRISADMSLKIIAQQANVQVLFPYDQVKTVKTNALRGRYTLADALRLVLDGTGLTADLTERGVIRVMVAPERPENGPGSGRCGYW